MESRFHENFLVFIATELPETELRKTLWSLVQFPKLKRQVLLYEPQVTKPSEFTEDTLFKINHEFAILKNGKLQKRGKINLIGRLQLSTEKARKEENESIMQLRILRTQEAIIKILKMRKVCGLTFFLFWIMYPTTYLGLLSKREKNMVGHYIQPNYIMKNVYTYYMHIVFHKYFLKNLNIFVFIFSEYRMPNFKRN